MTSQNTTERSESSSPESATSTKSVRLTRATASRWLGLLSRMTSQDSVSTPGLEQLWNRLEDDCWLACWKREEVDFDFCPAMITEVLQELLQFSQTDLTLEDLSGIEEMTQILSSSPLTNSDQN